jgi:hypothetical protein
VVIASAIDVLPELSGADGPMPEMHLSTGAKVAIARSVLLSFGRCHVRASALDPCAVPRSGHLFLAVILEPDSPGNALYPPAVMIKAITTSENCGNGVGPTDRGFRYSVFPNGDGMIALSVVGTEIDRPR